jgi:hypothetical protein
MREVSPTGANTLGDNEFLQRGEAHLRIIIISIFTDL